MKMGSSPILYSMNLMNEKFQLSTFIPTTPDYEMAKKILNIGFGSIKNNKSKTGFISIFDGLICDIK